MTDHGLYAATVWSVYYLRCLLITCLLQQVRRKCIAASLPFRMVCFLRTWKNTVPFVKHDLVCCLLFHGDGCLTWNGKVKKKDFSFRA